MDPRGWLEEIRMLQQNRDAYMRKIKEIDFRISYLNQRIEQHQQQQLTRYKTEPPLFCGNNESKPFGLGFKSKPVITKYTATTEIDTIEVLDHVKMIRCGSSITYLLTENNELYACGSNAFGQLGLGDTTDRLKFERVPLDKSIIVKDIQCGWFFTLILTTDDKLYSTGFNTDGQLCLGHYDNQCTFTRLPLAVSSRSSIAQIACGGSSCAVIIDRMLYTGGYNAHGQLALGDTESRPLLSLVLFDYQVKQVAQGSYFTLILTDHNEVFLAGRDTYHNSVKTFRKIRFDFINNRVTNIYCGASHSILVTSTNSLYIFGDNTEGQLCVGQDTAALEDPVMIMLPSPDRIKFIATHLSYATYLVTEKDELFVSGGNSDGQLGLGHIDPVHTLEKVELEGALKGQQQIIAMTCGVYCSALLIGKKTWDKEAKVKSLSAQSGFHDIEFEYVIEPSTPTK